MTEQLVCLPKVLPREFWISAALTATEINPVNHPPIERLLRFAPRFTATPEHIAVLTTKYWQPGGVRLTVGFLDNPPADLRARILLHMNAWGKTANVVFASTRIDPLVRIARGGGSSGGYWSYLGTDVLSIPREQPTMNLEAFTMRTAESEFRRIVRHEAGHAMGFPHEHMRRELVNRIDPEKAIAFFGQAQGWSRQEVIAQVLTPLEESSLLGMAHTDPNSIMCYQIPGSLMKDGKPIVGGLDIDSQDYTFAAKIYPKRVRASVPARVTPSVPERMVGAPKKPMHDLEQERLLDEVLGHTKGEGEEEEEKEVGGENDDDEEDIDDDDYDDEEYEEKEDVDAEAASTTTPPKRPPRYANAALLSETTGSLLDPAVPLIPASIVRLRLDIGKLSSDSQVRKPKPFPDKKLPKDVNLDVMVTSSDFLVQAARRKKNGGRFQGAAVAHGRFFLPGDGGPATMPDGRRFLDFRLRVPERGGTARCRIGYYYRNVLVQSQQVVAAVEVGNGFKIETDFTLSADLTQLENIPERPRVSVLTNSNGDGVHQIALRSVPGRGKVDGKTFRINEENVGKTIELLRSALAARAPTAKRRSRKDLADDLREFAPHGWTLYTQMPAQHAQMFQPLYEQPELFVVQVLRPTSSGFVFPWALVYEIPLLNLDRLRVCPLVREWQDDKHPLITGAPAQCPRGPHGEDVLCPFGFWGFRYAIEQLSSTDRPDLQIPVPSAGSFVVAQTQVEVNLLDLENHVNALRTTLADAFPDARLLEAKDKASVRTELGQDLPLVYFYCHGERRNDADPDTWLGVGNGESLTAKEFIGWVVIWLRDGKQIWDKVRPLVFVNACHSVAIFPNTLLSYLDAFVSTAHAAGVIGTEVKVHQKLAADIAQRFFELFLGGRQSVESTLRTIRFEYLASGNMLGLVYTPYCWADLHVVPEKLPVLGLDSPH